MTHQSFIRPSDRLAPEDYPEWLQADAAFHAPMRWRPILARAALALAIVAALIALPAAASALHTLTRPTPAVFGDAGKHPVAP